MNAILQILNRLLDVCKTLSWLPPLLARITVGWVFIESGWGKLHHLDKVKDFFASLGLPAPGFQAVLVANVEFFGGILLIAGLCTRLVSVKLSAILIVAIATAKREELTGFSALIGFTEFLYLLLLTWLILSGPGALALDLLLGRWVRKRG